MVVSNDPNSQYKSNAFYPSIGTFGCRGTWQAYQGDVIHAYYDTNEQKEKSTAKQGLVEFALKTYLYDSAKLLQLTLGSLAVLTSLIAI